MSLSTLSSLKSVTLEIDVRHPEGVNLVRVYFTMERKAMIWNTSVHAQREFELVLRLGVYKGLLASA